jgi:hypothetical protein
MNATNEEVWKALGRENMGVLRWVAVHRLEHPNCHFVRQRIVHDGTPVWCDTLGTRKGCLTQIRSATALPGVEGLKKHYVETVEDYYVLNCYLRDITVVEDLRDLKKAIEDLGDQGLPHVALPRTPYQALWIEWVSITDLALHVADAPDLVEETMGLLGGILLDALDIAYRVADKVDIPYIAMGDNITAPVIGEPRFRKYCLPYYQTISDRMAEKNISFIPHMDGDLRPLWAAIGESRIMGIDSLSPPPDNDTSVAEAVRMWPEMRLLVNYPSSVHLCDPETIYRQATKILEEGGHTGRLWIQASENVPPGGWRKSFPQIVKAIHEFGEP